MISLQIELLEHISALEHSIDHKGVLPAITLMIFLRSAPSESTSRQSRDEKTVFLIGMLPFLTGQIESFDDGHFHLVVGKEQREDFQSLRSNRILRYILDGQ